MLKTGQKNAFLFENCTRDHPPKFFASLQNFDPFKGVVKNSDLS